MLSFQQTQIQEIADAVRYVDGSEPGIIGFDLAYRVRALKDLMGAPELPPPPPTEFAQADLAGIQEVAKWLERNPWHAYTEHNPFKPGDFGTEVINGIEYPVRVFDFLPPYEKANGKGRPGVLIGMWALLDDPRTVQMQTGTGNLPGWGGSPVRNELVPSIFDGCRPKLQDAITPVIVKTTHRVVASGDVPAHLIANPTIDTFFPPSRFEVERAGFIDSRPLKIFMGPLDGAVAGDRIMRYLDGEAASYNYRSLAGVAATNSWRGVDEAGIGRDRVSNTFHAIYFMYCIGAKQ